MAKKVEAKKIVAKLKKMVEPKVVKPTVKTPVKKQEVQKEPYKNPFTVLKREKVQEKEVEVQKVAPPETLNALHIPDTDPAPDVEQKVVVAAPETLNPTPQPDGHVEPSG